MPPQSFPGLRAREGPPEREMRLEPPGQAGGLGLPRPPARPRLPERVEPPKRSGRPGALGWAMRRRLPVQPEPPLPPEWSEPPELPKPPERAMGWPAPIRLRWFRLPGRPPWTPPWSYPPSPPRWQVKQRRRTPTPQAPTGPDLLREGAFREVVAWRRRMSAGMFAGPHDSPIRASSGQDVRSRGMCTLMSMRIPARRIHAARRTPNAPRGERRQGA